MKSLASILSSLFVGLLMGASNFAPILELQRLLAHRRRVFGAAAVGAAAFVFLMSAILLGSIDAAFQYDDQGFIFWNALLSLAVTFLVAAIVLGFVARAMLPKPTDSIMPGMTENIMQVLQSMIATATSREPQSPTAEATASASERMAEPPVQPEPSLEREPSPAPFADRTPPPSRTAFEHHQPGYAH